MSTALYTRLGSGPTIFRTGSQPSFHGAPPPPPTAPHAYPQSPSAYSPAMLIPPHPAQNAHAHATAPPPSTHTQPYQKQPPPPMAGSAVHNTAPPPHYPHHQQPQPYQPQPQQPYGYAPQQAQSAPTQPYPYAYPPQPQSAWSAPTNVPLPPGSLPPHPHVVMPIANSTSRHPSLDWMLMQHINPPLPPSAFDSYGRTMTAPAAVGYDPYAALYPHSHPHQQPYVDSVDAEAEQLVIRKIDRKAASLQKHGQHLEAMELLEQGLTSRIHLFGAHSIHVVDAVEKLALVYNSVAMTSLYAEDYPHCLQLLRQADTLLTTHPESSLLSVRIQTLNNLACCYRRQHRPKQALSMLRQSLQLLAQAHTDATVQQQQTYTGYPGHDQRTQANQSLVSNDHVDSRAVTHLNICAILSQLGKHKEALEHAKAAVLHCQKQLLNNQSSSISTRFDPDTETDRDTETDTDTESFAHSSRTLLTNGRGNSRSNIHETRASQSAALTEKIVILGIAYHNLGVEEEFLKHYDACLEWYEKAYQLAQQHVGENQPITNTFAQSLNAAKKQIEFHRASTRSLHSTASQPSLHTSTSLTKLKPPVPRFSTNSSTLRAAATANKLNRSASAKGVTAAYLAPTSSSSGKASYNASGMRSSGSSTSGVRASTRSIYK